MLRPSIIDLYYNSTPIKYSYIQTLRQIGLFLYGNVLYIGMGTVPSIICRYGAMIGRFNYLFWICPLQHRTNYVKHHMHKLTGTYDSSWFVQVAVMDPNTSVTAVTETALSSLTVDIIQMIP